MAIAISFLFICNFNYLLQLEIKILIFFYYVYNASMQTAEAVNLKGENLCYNNLLTYKSRLERSPKIH